MAKESQLLLAEIIKMARASKAAGVPFKAIFDLDSTIFDVSPRIAKIFHAFAALPGIKEKYQKEAAILEKIQPHPSDYGVKRTLARGGFTTEDTTEEFIQLLVAFWKKNFFSNAFLHHDRPYPGVQKYISDLHGSGAEILYLTGRDVPRMLEGTVESLMAHGFPLKPDRSNLILKPSPTLRDHDFKKRFFEEMERTKGDVWFFENEPANIFLVLETSPHVKIVFVDTVHSGIIPAPTTEVHRISGFK